MTFCKNCGTKLNPQDEFCPNCGTKNETPQQPQQPDGMGADAVTAVPGGKKPFLGMNTKGLLIAAAAPRAWSRTITKPLRIAMPRI